jgi:CTP synthase
VNEEFKVTRYIFVTGGVMSSLGKGIASATIGALLQAHGFSVRMKKMDPYINVDPGTLSPHKHGEVFVLNDGCESDLDFGHYERFTNIQCGAADSLTMGKIYEKVLAKERHGAYLGSDIQVIPHITNEVKDFICNPDSNCGDFVICEVGGTVGDIEGLPYIEAIRQLTLEMGKEFILSLHLTYLPYIKTSRELKTKPTQHSVKVLQSMGIQPDIILCRSEKDISDEIKTKISAFCNVKKENIIAALDAENIYLIPNMYHSAGLDTQILHHFKLDDEENGGTKKYPHELMGKWVSLEHSVLNPTKSTRIAVVGKYVQTKDAYISLEQAISHAGFANDVKIDVDWLDSRVDPDVLRTQLENVSGIIVPGGFDTGGIDGKIAAIKYARENDVPFLGICLGLQLAVIEACRNVAGVSDATSREFSDEGRFVIDFMDSWTKDGVLESRAQADNKGGTMRLGNYACKISPKSLAHKIYGTTDVTERHRHRFEVNIEQYKDVFAKAGLIFSGVSADGLLPEIVERRDHSFFIATQAHPEFKSRPFSPHLLFSAFINAVIINQDIKFKCSA